MFFQSKGIYYCKIMKNQLNLFYYCVVILVFVILLNGYTNAFNHEESTDSVIKPFNLPNSHFNTSFEYIILDDNSSCDCGPNSEECWRNNAPDYEQYCKCKKGYAPRRQGKDEFCEECDCGKFGLSCNFDGQNDRKNCTCAKGYGLKLINVTTGEQTCEECDCGTNGVDCMKFPGEVKLCFCQIGNYSHKFATTTDEKCKECECGPQSVSCDFNSDKKQFCKCKPGYFSKKIPALNDSEFCERCDCGEHGQCNIKVVENRSINECICDSGYLEFKGKCKKCDCGLNSLNCTLSKRDGNQMCVCKEGYLTKEKYFWEDEYCERCDCGEFGETCKFVLGDRRCTCKEGYTSKSTGLKDGICEKPCDCGLYGKCKAPLVDSKSIKECICEPGYVEFDGQCESCECGSNSVSCNFTHEGNRFCKCKEGYYSKKAFETSPYAYCEKCDCGEHGKCEVKVMANRSIKECICEPGYLEFRGRCQKCDCGVNSLNCTFHDSTGNLMCDCKRGYITKQSYLNSNAYCESCDCGEHSVSCKFELGRQICTCQEGYTSFSNDIDNYCSKGSSLSGGMIAFIVIAVILIVVVVAAVIFKFFFMPSRQY